LFKVTEEFREYWRKPIRKVVVTPYEAPFFRAFAAKYDISWAVYAPAWLDEYIAGLRRRQRRFSVPAPRKMWPTS